MENFTHFSRTVTTDWDEEVTIDTDFINGEPRINVFTKGAIFGQNAQAQITLYQALRIRDGLSEAIDSFLKAGYNL